jgi:hypothetical protein
MAEIKDNVSAGNPGIQQMVRLDIYVKRHPSLTVEEFHKCENTVLDFMDIILTKPLLGVGLQSTAPLLRAGLLKRAFTVTLRY